MPRRGQGIIFRRCPLAHAALTAVGMPVCVCVCVQEDGQVGRGALITCVTLLLRETQRLALAMGIIIRKRAF